MALMFGPVALAMADVNRLVIWPATFVTALGRAPLLPGGLADGSHTAART